MFAAPAAQIRNDRSAAHDERRMQILGYSLFGRLLLVVHVELHETTIRIISAHRLNAKERRRLERQ